MFESLGGIQHFTGIPNSKQNQKAKLHKVYFYFKVSSFNFQSSFKQQKLYNFFHVTNFRKQCLATLSDKEEFQKLWIFIPVVYINDVYVHPFKLAYHKLSPLKPYYGPYSIDVEN